MKLFFKMKPLLRSAQAEEELAALRAELRGLRGALATAEAKRQELEETQVSVTQEKNDLALQLQAVSGTGAQVANETLESDWPGQPWNTLGTWTFCAVFLLLKCQERRPIDSMSAQPSLQAFIHVS